MAILRDEPDAERCLSVMEGAKLLAMSAGTLAELRIVAGHRKIGPALDLFLEKLAPEIVAVTAEDARAVAEAHARWGKGVHPAALNFGDCFAYALATSRNWPLLYVGEDFAQTDVAAA